MKKAILLLLLTATQLLIGRSQPVIVYGNLVTPPNQTESIFNIPRPGNSAIKFDFLFPSRNKMTMELSSMKQINNLPNLDSLLNSVWENIQFLRDWQKDGISSHRIDYYTSLIDTKIRISSYNPVSDVFRIKDSTVSLLKIEQDTLRIRLFTVVTSKADIQYYYINLFLNSINDLPALISSGTAEDGVTLLRNDISRKLNSSKIKQTINRAYAIYDLKNMKRLSPPSGNSIINYGEASISLPPNFCIGMQYVRGNWIASAGVGLDVVKHLNSYEVYHYGILWEPYYVFRKDIKGKNIVERNSFLSFKYSYRAISQRTNREIQFLQSLGVGFLIRRRGEVFEPSTYKISLSGIQTRNLLLEPELYFNKLFKNINPSLKLTVNFSIE